MRTPTNHHINGNILCGRYDDDSIFPDERKLFATYECVKNRAVTDSNENNYNQNGTQKGILVHREIDDSAKKPKSKRSVSFQTDEEEFGLSSDYFGVKSYLHHFYEPLNVSEGIMKGDDFEFYVEPKTKRRYLHCSKCTRFLFIVMIVALYTAGVLCLFAMPEEMEYSALGISVFLATVIISFVLTAVLIWWMCASITQARSSEQPVVYSAIMDADLMKQVYNDVEKSYIRKIPLTGKIKAVQFEN